MRFRTDQVKFELYLDKPHIIVVTDFNPDWNPSVVVKKFNTNSFQYKRYLQSVNTTLDDLDVNSNYKVCGHSGLIFQTIDTLTREQVFGQTSKSRLNISKAVESKLVKQEVSCTVILPFPK